LEKGRQHHNLVGIRCRDIFPISQLPSEHFTVRKEMIPDQLQDFALISSRFLEHFRTGSGHGARGKNPKQRFTESQEMALVCMRRIEMAVEGKGALGFGLNHHFMWQWKFGQ
jgi:hypothetical protein